MRFIFSVLLFIAAVWYLRTGPVEPTEGVSAPKPPIQTPTQKNSWTQGDVTIKPLYRYELTARVLKKRRYYFDEGAKFCPIDLALGWQDMSNPAFYKKLNINQYNRWYHYTYPRDFSDPSRIVRMSANTHIVPASEVIKKEIFSLRENETVELKGYLIEVTDAKGGRWVSSTTREDTAGGSCELMWVEGARKIY